MRLICIWALFLISSCGVYLRRDDKLQHVVAANNESGYEVRSVSGKRRNAVLFTIEDNIYSYSSAGGSEQVSSIGFLTPFFIAGKQGNSVRLYEYSQENLFDRYMSNKKRIKGWTDRDNLIDFESVFLLRQKYYLSVNEISVLNNPEKYFVNADSLWLFSGANLERKCGAISLYKPVYLIKHSKSEESVLVAERPLIPFPYACNDSIRKWYSSVAIGWISKKFLSGPFNNSIKKIEIRDSAKICIPWMQKSKLSLAEYEKMFCKRINFIFLLPDKQICYNNRAELVKIFRESQTAINENIESKLKNYSVNFFMISPNSNKVLIQSKISQDFFNQLNRYLYGILKERTTSKTESVYDNLYFMENVLKSNNKYESNAIHYIFHIGESATANIKCDVSKLLRNIDYRLIAYQLDGSQNTLRQNFILQAADLLKSYSKQTMLKNLDNKIFYIANGGEKFLVKEIRLKEYNSHTYMLDVPEYSSVEGAVLFPSMSNFNTVTSQNFSAIVNLLLSQLYNSKTDFETFIKTAFTVPDSNTETFSIDFIKYLNKFQSQSKNNVFFPDKSRIFFGKQQLYCIVPNN